MLIPDHHPGFVTWERYERSRISSGPTGGHHEVMVAERPGKGPPCCRVGSVAVVADG